MEHERELEARLDRYQRYGYAGQQELAERLKGARSIADRAHARKLRYDRHMAEVLIRTALGAKE